MLAAFALVPACGFSPAYAPGGAGLALRGRIAPAPPEDALGFAFAARIGERLGQPGPGALTLGYRIETIAEGLAITPDQATQRYTLAGRLDWQLTDAGGAVVASGRIDSFTAYSAIGTTVATRAAERDAGQRLAVILADRLVTRLLARPEAAAAATAAASAAASQDVSPTGAP